MKKSETTTDRFPLLRFWRLIDRQLQQNAGADLNLWSHCRYLRHEHALSLVNYAEGNQRKGRNLDGSDLAAIQLDENLRICFPPASNSPSPSATADFRLLSWAIRQILGNDRHECVANIVEPALGIFRTPSEWRALLNQNLNRLRPAFEISASPGAVFSQLTELARSQATLSPNSAEADFDIGLKPSPVGRVKKHVAGSIAPPVRFGHRIRARHLVWSGTMATIVIAAGAAVWFVPRLHTSKQSSGNAALQPSEQKPLAGRPDLSSPAPPATVRTAPIAATIPVIPKSEIPTAPRTTQTIAQEARLDTTRATNSTAVRKPASVEATSQSVVPAELGVRWDATGTSATLTLSRGSKSEAIRFVHVEGGTYQRGDGAEDAPKLRATVSPYYISEDEVTGAEWDLVLTTSGIAGAGNTAKADISWQEAQRFCQAITHAGGPFKEVRLPLEVEWEYVAAQQTNRAESQRQFKHLFDGLAEWMQDAYSEKAYWVYDNNQDYPRGSPAGPEVAHVVRGGSTLSGPAMVFRRLHADDQRSSAGMGFRLVAVLK